MNYLKQPEYHIDFIDWDSSLYFNTEEACQLLNHEVVRLEDRAYLPNPPTEKVGIVVGVLTMNEEVEVLAKFSEGIEQLSKVEFCSDYCIVPEPIIDSE